MKKYNFPLNNVLNFRDQVLENLKNEHAQVLLRVSEQEKLIASLRQKYQNASEELEEKMAGQMMGMNEVLEYRRYINNLYQKIGRAEQTLLEIRKEEEKKRSEVIEAKKEKASIERLKEKSKLQYQLEYQKSEELLIEEFVSNTRLIHAEK